MSFFDELSEKVSNYAKIIGDEAEKVMDKSVNQINIYSQKEKISKLYKNLGQYIYENRNSLGESEIGAMLREIDAQNKILEKMNEDAASAPKQKVCICGYKTKATFEYCPKCGNKF